MGDLRNKFAKMERDEAVKALQARMEAKPPLVPPRCRCGHTAQEKPRELCCWQTRHNLLIWLRFGIGVAIHPAKTDTLDPIGMVDRSQHGGLAMVAAQ